MRTLPQQEAQMERYEGIGTMWALLVDAYGIFYARGRQGSLLTMRELLDSDDDVEYAPMVRLEVFLASLSLVTDSSDDFMIVNP